MYILANQRFHKKQKIKPLILLGLKNHFFKKQKVMKTSIDIIMYLRPNGRKKIITFNVDPNIAKLSKNLVLSMECISTINEQDKQFAIYCRHKHESEEQETIVLANKDSVQEKLEYLVKTYEKK
jgi:hypothetical protein